MRPSGRMFCFTAPLRAPAGACAAPPPLAPARPVAAIPSRKRHNQPLTHGEERSKSFPLTQRSSGTHTRHAPSAAHSAHTVAHTARSRPNPPRTPRARAAAFTRTEHVTHLPVRRRPTSRRPPRRPVESREPPRSAALFHHAPFDPRARSRGALRLLSRPSHAGARLYNPHAGATQAAQIASFTASPRTVRHGERTPASAHRSTARKSPVLPAGRTGREASEASTAARSAADSLKRLSP